MRPLRQEQRDFAGAEITRRAIALFIERGYDEVTVDEIAAAAGISARTFFRYFPSKSDVLRQHQRFLFDRLALALAARPPKESPSIALRKAFLATGEMRADDRARFVALGRLLIDHDTSLGHAFAFESERIDELVRVLVDRGATHDLDLEATVGALLGAAQASFRYWVRNPDEAPLVEVMQRALRRVKSGSITPAPERNS